MDEIQVISEDFEPVVEKTNPDNTGEKDAEKEKKTMTTSLHDAIRNFDPETLKTLIDTNPDSINDTDEAGNTPLHVATIQLSDVSKV